MGPYPYGNAYPSVGASLVAQSVKNLPTVQETWVRSPGWEDPLEKWQPTPVSLPRKSHGQKSLVGCSPWGHKGSGTTERLTLTYLLNSFRSMRLKCKSYLLASEDRKCKFKMNWTAAKSLTRTEILFNNSNSSLLWYRRIVKYLCMIEAAIPDKRFTTLPIIGLEVGKHLFTAV